MKLGCFERLKRRAVVLIHFYPHNSTILCPKNAYLALAQWQNTQESTDHWPVPFLFQFCNRHTCCGCVKRHFTIFLVRPVLFTRSLAIFFQSWIMGIAKVANQWPIQMHAWLFWQITYVFCSLLIFHAYLSSDTFVVDCFIYHGKPNPDRLICGSLAASYQLTIIFCWGPWPLWGFEHGKRVT